MASRPVTVRLPRLDQIVPGPNRKALLAHLAALAIGRIKRRTGAGLDVSGKKFAEYSDRYAMQRKRAGRQVSPATLTLSGAMLASLAVLSVNEAKAVLGFQGTAPQYRFARRKRALYGRGEIVASAWGEKGRNRYARGKLKATHTFAETNKQIPNALKAQWNDKGQGVPRRHFFGLSAADKLELSRTALRELLKMAQRASLARVLGRMR
jgi:hypothetical protein